MRLSEEEYAHLLALGRVQPLEAHRGPGPSVPEKHLMAQILREVRLAGLLVYHTHDSRRSEAGFPDLVLVDPRPGPGPCYLWELKSRSGKVTLEQQTWLTALDGKTISARVVRPADFEDLVRLLQAPLDVP